ncbi:MAG: hypothetical protein WC761_02210 [Candidatus Paceibacterota bacterium]|jgi:hypothetical protein
MEPFLAEKRQAAFWLEETAPGSLLAFRSCWRSMPTKEASGIWQQHHLTTQVPILITDLFMHYEEGHADWSIVIITFLYQEKLLKIQTSFWGDPRQIFTNIRKSSTIST